LFSAWSTAGLPILEMVGIGEPDLSQVSENPYFRRAQAIAGARAAHAATTGSEATTSRMPLPLYQALATLGVLQAACEPARFEEEWVSALHGLAVSALPFLDAPMGKDLLRAVAPDRCPESVPDRLHSWIELYRTVAARDAQHMAIMAERLLAEEQSADVSRRQYLLAAAMLGRLGQDRPQAALELWTKHSDRQADSELAPDLRLLVSLALSRQEGLTASAP
jgi:hypothetical protein